MILLMVLPYVLTVINFFINVMAAGKIQKSNIENFSFYVITDNYMVQSISSNNLIKQASEIRTYSMDFANLMASDETISTKSVTSELRGGGITDLTITSETISGQIITMVIAGGTKANTYRIEVIITTSGGSTLEGDGLLKISN